MTITLEEFYDKHKETVVAIYQTGSTVFGVENPRNADYIFCLRTRADAEKIQDDIVWLKRSSDGKINIFLCFLDEPQIPSPIKYYAIVMHYNKLLYGSSVDLYQVLDHRDEQIEFLKRIVTVAKGKRWVYVYVLAIVLQRDSYELTDEDISIIKAIHEDGITEEQKAFVVAIAKSL